MITPATALWHGKEGWNYRIFFAGGGSVGGYGYYSNMAAKLALARHIVQYLRPYEG